MIEWFIIGIGIVLGILWWGFLVRWNTFDTARQPDPFHFFIKFEPKYNPDIGFGITAGTFCFILSPIWLPIYLICGIIHKLKLDLRAIYFKMLRDPR